jgi:hypothetical protein
MKKLLVLLICILSFPAFSQNVIWQTTGMMYSEPNSIVKVPINVGFPMNVGAISLTLNFPDDQLEILSINAGWGNLDNLQFMVYPDMVRIGWYAPPFLYLNTGQAMLCIKCKTLAGFNVAGFTLKSDPDNEIADNYFNTIPGALLTSPKIQTVKAYDGDQMYNMLGQPITNPDGIYVKNGKTYIKR